MQDAFMGNWARESHLSTGHARSLCELNHRFLDWAGNARHNPRCTAAVAALGDHLGSLSPKQRAAVADCPYALFDLRFHDVLHWRTRLQSLDLDRIADEPGHALASNSLDDTSRFVQLALFYAWHVAANASLAAQLVLGMKSETAAAFGRMTVNHLPGLVATEAAHLAPRWSDCSAYWTTLTNAALCADRIALRRAQLYGLQLAAAGRLPSG